MPAKQTSLHTILCQCAFSVVVLYLVFFPIVYAITSADIRQPNSFILPGHLYLAGSILKLLLVILIGLFIRKKSETILQSSSAQRKKYSLFILGVLVAKGLLTMMGIPQYLYGSISNCFGIFDVKNGLVFWPLVWEQMFSSYLFFSILLCMAIVFFHKPLSLFCNQNEA